MNNANRFPETQLLIIHYKLFIKLNAEIDDYFS